MQQTLAVDLTHDEVVDLTYGSDDEAAVAFAAAAADVEAAALLEFTLWDLAGQAVYRASHQCTFSAHALYVCAVAATDDADAAAAKVLSWYDYLQDSQPGGLL